MEMLEENQWTRPEAGTSPEIRARVAAMLATIEEQGDQAIADFSQQIDGFLPRIIDLEPWQSYDLDDEVSRHLAIAARRIEHFAQQQKAMYRDLEISDEYGRYGQKIVPLARMAAYIPGGRFPLVSTALMTLIPARVAGVSERVALSPSLHPGILAAASLAGATRFIHIGGAQAIAAAALGTSYLAAVDMVVGPGNAYVNTAKALLQDRIKIDTLAGPSEILVLCDTSIDPTWVALDILAQAEHDPMALSVVGCNSRSQLDAIREAIKVLQARFPEKDSGIIQFVYCQDGEAMAALCDRMAPEHLHVACSPEILDPMSLRNYGSLFIGPHSAVALGDYCTGPNHTLPTLGVARQKGGLSVGDFLKVLTFQEITGNNYNQLAETAIALAELEDLHFHRLSLLERKG